MTGYAVSIGWAEPPLRRFVEDASVQLAVLMHPTGQVLAQVGFRKSLDVQTACALSAAIVAAAGRLGELVEGVPFRGLHYVGQDRQFYLGEIPAHGSSVVLFAVFDSESSLGIVQLYLEELRANIAVSAPAVAESTLALAEDFERDLNRNLAQLFGRGDR